MISFIVNMQELFSIRRNTTNKNDDDFKDEKRSLLIPMYQREYKWKDEKIVGLIHDIKVKSKFLGIIILDEQENTYEIVDGQQRITTCLLILMALYNHNYGSPNVQKQIQELIQPNSSFVLKNDTVGEFISVANNKMSLSFDENADIYHQENDFKRAYDTIFKMLGDVSLVEFQRKLKDCDFLILINDRHTYSNPIEQVFLDINEKTQALDVEDIFKGHCFEIYDQSCYTQLKEKWVHLKRCAFGFERFGYKNLSHYLYLYILERNGNIPENLTVNGAHYLEGNNMDQTQRLLDNMISYGNRILSFRDNLSNNEYLFNEFYPKAETYNNSPDIAILKQLAIELLDYQNAQYQKFPFMNLISHLLGYSTPSSGMNHVKLRMLFSNLYIYAMLFVFCSDRKNKDMIDRSVSTALDENSFDEAVKAAKALRCNYVDEFVIAAGFKEDFSNFVYTIIDFFSSNEQRFTNKYCRENGYSKEHFIVPNNRGKRITWRDSFREVELEIRKEHLSSYIKRTINYIVIPTDLNECLEHDDIVSKISSIKNWYKSRNKAIPNHVQIFIDHIEKMSSYNALMDLKDKQHVDSQIIIDQYNVFIEEYFGEDKQNILIQTLTNTFKKAFQN